jgi:hypothetical protein
VAEDAEDLIFQGEKTLFIQEAYAGYCDPDDIHTWDALLVRHIHTHVSLLTGRIHVDRLVFVED